jgi:hypothetical protein
MLAHIHAYESERAAVRRVGNMILHYYYQVILISVLCFYEVARE